MVNVTTPILGRGTVSAEAIQAWFGKDAPAELGQVIVSECRRYPQYVVNHDVVAGQIHEETGGWTSEYARERNNPAGLGAIDSNPDEAITFPSVRAGVQAQIAHLLAYAVGDGPWLAADPRGDAVRAKGWLGAATTIGALTGKWATDPQYGKKVVERTTLLIDFANNGSWEREMKAQIPGFTWFPAAETHYEKGRTTKIRGGAQHYSAGTNSLPWLTTESGKDNPKLRVSAHFLVKHNPTMEDRGWQMVRIEDTAWTTANANPYVVAIEYEHVQGQPIPDIAYEVLAQTWADITEYVAGNGEGAIEVVRGHKEWVGNPSLVCPDGIDVNRIEYDRRQILKRTNKNAMRWFPETGHTVGGGFLHFWEHKGGLEVFGYPLTDEVLEDERVVQYFERARFEYHPENPEPWTVLLGRVGSELLATRKELEELKQLNTLLGAEEVA